MRYVGYLDSKATCHMFIIIIFKHRGILIQLVKKGKKVRVSRSSSTNGNPLLSLCEYQDNAYMHSFFSMQ